MDMAALEADVHHQTFAVDDLIHWLNIVAVRWPDARLGRSGHGTGNINVYQDGEYRAVIDLGGGRVELTDFDEPDED
jgi:hypothetical protein